MTEEMKLLRAFIEAAGYEVESNNYTDEWEEPQTDYKVTKKASNPRKAKAEGYTSDFERCWSIYPKRPNNGKQDAFSQFQQRIKEGIDPSELFRSTVRYAAFCDVTDKTGKETVLQAATFYGNKKRYEADFTPPKKDPEWAKLPRNDDLWEFAKKHGFSNPGQLNFPAYRKKLEQEIEQRMMK